MGPPRLLSPLLLLLVLLLPLLPATAAAGFVEAEGTHLVDGPCRFDFAGTNCYYLMVYGADPGLRPHAREVLDEAALMGCTVLRTWAFNDGASQWNALQTAPGVYNETVFQALDWVVAKADSAGLRLVLPLVNNWDDYGGMNQYVQWARALPPVGTGFVTRSGKRFLLDGRTYGYVGANFGYGLNLASCGPGGDRARLLRELDELRERGITNLRIMAGSEGPDTEPWRMVPSLQSSPGVYDAQVLDGLDYLLAAMKERGLRAVMCLNNFWPWSGGMAQYVSWNGGGPIPYPPPEPGGDWELYQDYASDFYSNAGAMQDFRDHIAVIVNRVNPYTGLAYKNDPTIFSWELANEPRGYHNNAAAFNTWIDNTAAYVKSLDSNHLVTTGCEGDSPWPAWNGLDFNLNHNGPHIDYTTIHIWPQNWGWYDPANPSGTYGTAESNARSYYNTHEAKAVTLGKPMVLEEFGLARDGGSFDPASGTNYRDTFYAAMFSEVYASLSASGPGAGSNFWAWAGEGRPLAPYGGYWSPGDPWIGDPPHEQQGWYSVYDSDAGTEAAIAAHATQLFAYLGPSVHDDFYTHPTCRQLYKDHVEAVLTRVNTITGVAYRDDPTILCWELGNEPRAQSDNTGAKMQAWIEEMAPFFKSIDPNHLLTTGQEGFYDYNSGPWWQNGSQGTNFITNHQVPEIDLCTFHLWPSHWSWDYSQSLSWVNGHIADAHGTIGKPIYVGEFGYPRDGGGGTATRDQLYQGVFDAFETQSASGALFWILYHDAYPDYDGFGVYYPADASTIAIIEAAAEALGGADPPENLGDFSAEARSGEEGVIDLAWSEPDGITGVRIYRKGVGGYPLYDGGGGVVPEWPASEGEALAQGWTLVVDQAPGMAGCVDEPGARDMYYYAGFTVGCGGLTALGCEGARGRSLSYHLGDFDADGSIYFEDLVLFSNAFDTCTGQPGFTAAVDIGPTDDATELGLPLTDGCVGFEDLMVLALAWDGGGRRLAHPRLRADGPQAEEPVLFWLEPIDHLESTGADEDARSWQICCATGGHALKGVLMSLTWSGAGAPPGDGGPVVQAGPAWGSPFWFHMSARDASASSAFVTAVVLGEGELRGERLVVATIELPPAGTASAIRLTQVDARDPHNRALPVQVASAPPTRTPSELAFRLRSSPAAGTLSLTIESPAAVTGTLYDVQGRAVATLGPWLTEGGSGTCEWDRRDSAGRRVGRGVYLLELRSGPDRRAGRIVLID